MGRIVGSIAAAFLAATIILMSGGGAGRIAPAAAGTVARHDLTPITASDAQQAGTMPRAPYLAPNSKYLGPTPVPDYGPSPTASPTPAPPLQVRIEGVRTDRVPTPGQLLFDKTRDIAFMDPLNWSVTIYKKRHRLMVYYKGALFKDYHAVFGRSFEPGTKLWEGDRRTPEGVYTIVGKHPSSRWDWFLTLNYPNDIDRHRYEQLRDGGEVPTAGGRPLGVGGRIGIHGTDEPELNSGNINWTTGCISVDDPDIDELRRLLPTGTVVIINP